MDMNWNSLHKVLRDETRRNIVGILSEKRDLNYTEIMTVLNITNTGRLNYHLKVLGDLITKDEQGRYSLSENGALAANMMRTFPERRIAGNNSSPLLRKVVSIILTVLGLALAGGITGFVLFIVSMPHAIVAIGFQLVLGLLLAGGIMLIATGVRIYKGKMWSSL